MKASLITLLFTLPLFTSVTATSHRRILHQPLFPASSTPPPPAPSDNPFFNEHTPYQPPPPPLNVAAEVGSNDTATHRVAPAPAKNSGKKIAVVVSVGVLTVGMLSGFVFFIYKYMKSKQHDNTTTFRDIGSVDNTTTFRSTTASESTNGTSNGSPYYKLKSVKLSDRYRPSPELQPLPPLSKPPPPPATATARAALTSDEEEEIHDFHTPQGSTATTDDGYSVRSLNPKRIRIHHSKKSSPRSRLSVSSSPETASVNPRPAKEPLPRLHINRSQQKTGSPIITCKTRGSV